MKNVERIVDISVCIPTRNSEKTLRICLDSIFRQTVKPREVLVCDGGSTDKSFEILKEYPVEIVATNVRGVGLARNVLASAASGKIIAWLDSDAAIPVNWLELRWKIHEEHPEIDCLSSLFPVMTLKEANERSEMPISGEIDIKPCERFVQGGATIKRSVIRKVGGYDSFFEWGEDWDLKTGLLRTDARLYYNRASLSYHMRSEKSLRWPKKFFVYEVKRSYLRDNILGGNFLCFLFKYGPWYIRHNPRHFATFLLRLWFLYSLIGIAILPSLALISLSLAVITNLVACKIHHRKLRFGFLLDQVLKAVGEHRNLFRSIVYRMQRRKVIL